MTLKLAPVPVAGVPPGADQENVYGEVPPVALALNVTAVPVVPVPGPDTVTERGCGATETGRVMDDFAPLLSVALNVKVKDPLVG